jgi:predicted RecA/RadA family phage recombinase
MKNFVQKGNKITLVATAAIASGAIVEVGALAGVSAGAYAIGDTAVVELCGVYNLPKGAGAISQGAKLYSDAAGNATATVGTNVFLGYAFESVLTGATSINVRLIF